MSDEESMPVAGIEPERRTGQTGGADGGRVEENGVRARLRVAEHRGGERQECDERQEEQVEPDETAIVVSQVPKFAVVGFPKQADNAKTDREAKELGLELVELINQLRRWS